MTLYWTSSKISIQCNFEGSREQHNALHCHTQILLVAFHVHAQLVKK